PGERVPEARAVRALLELMTLLDFVDEPLVRGVQLAARGRKRSLQPARALGEVVRDEREEPGREREQPDVRRQCAHRIPSGSRPHLERERPTREWNETGRRCDGRLGRTSERLGARGEESALRLAGPVTLDQSEVVAGAREAAELRRGKDLIEAGV